MDILVLYVEVNPPFHQVRRRKAKIGCHLGKIKVMDTEKATRAKVVDMGGVKILTFVKDLSRAMREDRVNLLKYMLAGAIGFGIGGVIWGFIIPPTTHYPIPFSYTTGSIALGSIGGASLALFSKDIKKMLKFALLGAIGLFIGFIIGVMLCYPFFFLGRGFIAVCLFMLSPLIPNSYKWEFIFSLKPSLAVGEFVFVFVVVGAIGGFFYGLAERKNIGSFTLSGAIGFGIGSLIAPVIGNLIGMAFNSLLATYVTTFMIIGVILGAFLGGSMYNTEKHSTNLKEEKDK